MNDDDLITLKEASSELFNGAQRIAFLKAEIRLGRLPASKIGRTYFVQRKDLVSLKAFGSLVCGPDNKRGGVYVVGYADYIKIGYSRNIDQRIDDLQVHAPERLTVYFRLPGDFRDEALLHHRFHGQRLNGEWFRLEGELAEWMRGGCIS